MPFLLRLQAIHRGCCASRKSFLESAKQRFKLHSGTFRGVLEHIERNEMRTLKANRAWCEINSGGDVGVDNAKHAATTSLSQVKAQCQRTRDELSFDNTV